MRKRGGQNSGFGFEFEFDFYLPQLNSIDFDLYLLYLQCCFILPPYGMGGGKKRCCCIEIERPRWFLVAWGSSNQKGRIYRQLRIGGEGKGQIPIPIPISNSNFNSRHVVFGHLELTSFPLFFLPLLLLQMYL